MGPIGLLLETVHLQAASLDQSWRFCQFNQQPVDLIGGPAQMMSPLLLRSAVRNRTRRAEGTREENVGLEEIDVYATNAKHKEEAPQEQKLVLRLMQSGSNWTKAVTARTGRRDTVMHDHYCDLCKTMREGTDHIWFCPKLQAKAKEIDADIAGLNPEVFPPALRKGVAVAMNANPRCTYWGGEPDRMWTADLKKLLGCRPVTELSKHSKELVEKLEATEDPAGCTAREVMEDLMAPQDGVRYFMPSIKQKVEEVAPAEPNGYSDGSLKNNKGLFWAVGGAGVWWPNRALDDLTTDEKTIAEHRQVAPDVCIFNPEAAENPGGVMLWTPFNARLNTSTRCELGAAILALLAPHGINIGIDNSAVVDKGNTIIHHLRRQAEEELFDRRGSKLLGGSLSTLHRSSPFKLRWALMQDGDLWEVSTEMVKKRGAALCRPYQGQRPRDR